MSDWDKLLEKIKKLDKNLRFDQVKKILESYGYEEQSPKSGSSHSTFRKKNSFPITIPKNQPVKIAYIKLVKSVIESEANHETDN